MGPGLPISFQQSMIVIVTRLISPSPMTIASKLNPLWSESSQLWDQIFQKNAGWHYPWKFNHSKIEILKSMLHTFFSKEYSPCLVSKSVSI